jgi:hypothetical protein
LCWKAWNSGGYAYYMAESLKIGINRQPHCIKNANGGILKKSKLGD